MCLYRVSTKGQVDKQDDIPMQRRECMEFIEGQVGWSFFDERMEKGVSGYKVSATKRDAIMEIRSMAEKKQFDILLVFMFDRLGRREDETPFLVQWFIEQGIEVWSTREGQQRLDNRVDKLLNFMRYWQAGGESEKISMRVKASHKQMTEDGIWRGGTKPFGYKLVHKGREGKKNRPLYDLAIDEVEGPIVQEVFHLICHEGYGTLRLANSLNERYPNPKKVWTAQTIRTMVKNPIYTGRMHMNDIVSEPNEDLRLISDEQMAFVRYALQSRIPRKYTEQRQAENEQMPATAQSKAKIFGATLLSGLLYCGHCNHKLVGGYCTKQRAYGAYHRPIYRCYHGAVKAKNCDGQTVYSAAKIEKAVLEVVKTYFCNIAQSMNGLWRDQARLQLRNKQTARLRSAQHTYDQLQAQQQKLRQEVMKSLSGESAFDAELLSDMLEENKTALATAEQALMQCKADSANEEARLAYLSTQYNHISDWAKEFEDVDGDTKKMILARIIEKITVDRNYHITIAFFIAQEEFEQQVTQSDQDVEILEAKRCISTLAG